MINHIAFIMDGNRRYAEKQNISLKKAYSIGMSKFLEFVSLQVKYKIKETSFYALSNDNYKKRAKDELETIFNLMKDFTSNRDIETFIKDNKIKLNLVGDIDALEKETNKAGISDKKLVTSLKQRFKDWYDEINNKEDYVVNIALKYDGQSEIVHACKEICRKVSEGELNSNKIDEKTIKSNMWFNGAPADVIVRPGDAPRLSGFMLWDSKYSEIFLTKKLWPELDESDLTYIFEWYKGIARNFGK